MRTRHLASCLAFIGLTSSVPAALANGGIDWTGFYLGAHVGGATGTATFSNPDGPPIFGDSVTTPGFLAGLQLGYNHQFAPQWLAGVEASASVLSSQAQNTCLQTTSTFVGSNCQLFPREVATLTGRLGYVTEPRGRTMVYGKAGVAWMRSDVSVIPNNANLTGFALTGDPNVEGDPARQSTSAWGWTVGVGLEHALSPRWSASLGYDYLRFDGMRVPVPQSINVTSAGAVTTVPPGGTAGMAQSLHVVRLGLNYRWGVGAATAEPAAITPSPSWLPDWEFEGGARYWYSWGNFQSANGPATSSLVSRLPYNNMEGHSGELFARLDSPFGVFVKGFVGGGGISAGTMYDEDWGLGNDLASEPTGYEITRSGINGSFNYFTADLGYNVLRGRDHRVGLFVGYNRYQYVLNTLGCAQMVAPGSGVCFPNIGSDTNAISEIDTWQSLRVGASADVEIAKRVRIGADIAYLPYVLVDGLDIHRLRTLYFPVRGTGNGVQAEIMISWRATDSFDIGIGGRYWSMWTTTAYQTDNQGNFMNLSADRYGVFVQASYRFNSGR
ncbi:MAG: porin family protein [Enhydrobacter sp.]|nr:MAG: porin family protein [Enhydrobacter sp.]